MSYSARRFAPGDLEILALLWEHGPLTIAEAHERIERPLGYTTVQTRLNRLVEKGCVGRSHDRPAKYQPLVTRDEVSRDALRALTEQVGGGSVVPLVARLLDDTRISPDELEALRSLLEQAESRLDHPKETS